MGFLSLHSVAVMSGVRIVAEINHVRRAYPEMGLAAAIVEGATARFRGVLLMIIVSWLGMVPAARAIGVGSDVQWPQASVLVGGLLSTLLRALVCLPALHALVAGRAASQR